MGILYWQVPHMLYICYVVILSYNLLIVQCCTDSKLIMLFNLSCPLSVFVTTRQNTMFTPWVNILSSISCLPGGGEMELNRNYEQISAESRIVNRILR